MTINNKSELVESEIIVADDTKFVEDAQDPAPTAQAAWMTDSSSIDPSKNLSTGITHANTAGKYASTAAQNVQHKRNVFIGVSSRVVVRCIVLGPIGVVLGGFAGRAIVRHHRDKCSREEANAKSPLTVTSE
jgi:hypothetical protein